MNNHKHTVFRIAALLVIVSVFTAPPFAKEFTVDPTTQFCFSSDDFTSAEADDGIFLTAVPMRSIATVRYGNRILKAGDALPTDALNQLTLETTSVSAQNAVVSYYTVSDGCVSGVKELKLSILSKKNNPPTAEDSELETYRNIPINGTLNASDPENGMLTYTLIREPKRGTAELHEDGSFTYSPSENKVGKDYFTFTVTDDAGNTSEEAKVTIQIKKPTDKATYSDMTDDPDAFIAMWMKEEGLFTGSRVGGNLCFEPNAAVSRGEFLVMAMKLVNAEASTASLSSGFADEDQTPAWMQPYIVSALGSGMISGVQSENGIVFLPEAHMTSAEAVVMLQNILQLPNNGTQAVFSTADSAAIPVWAEDAAAALAAAGIELETVSGTEAITRREVGKLLYQVQQLMKNESLATFYWVQ